MADMSTTPLERDAPGTVPLRESTAEEIRSLMARRRITGVVLANRIVRSQSYVSRRLTGETAFDIDDLERIATVLGVSVGDLLPPNRRGSGWEPTRRLAGNLEVATVERRIPLAPRVVAIAGQPVRRQGPPIPTNRAVRLHRDTSHDPVVRPVTQVAR